MTTKTTAQFPELSDEENGIIQIARQRGFARYWPSYPSAKAQAQNTFNGAKEWLQDAPEVCESCWTGEAHEHGKPVTSTAASAGTTE